MTKKKDSSTHSSECSEDAKRRLEEIERYWTREAMESAKPLPLELDEEESCNEAGSCKSKEVNEKRED